MSEATLDRVRLKPRRSNGAAARRDGSHAGAHVILIIGSVIMIFPFAWQIIMSLSTNPQVMSIPPTFWPGELQWKNYAAVFSAMPFMSQFWVSVTITVVRVIGQLVLCSMAGYAFARMKFSFKGLVLGLILAILMVPSQVFLIPQYQIVQDLGWLNSSAGIIAPGIFSAFGTFMMRQFFLGLPMELEEAARLDGCNPFETFWRIMLPLAKPGLSALAIITVLWSWNDLLWPLVVTTYAQNMPLSAGLATLQGQNATDYPVLMAASLMASAPILILFLAMQRRVIDGIAFSGMK
jgi:multiple sugar transport system permease protein